MPDYITTQGDMWDLISYKVYGTEKLMDKLIDANLQYRDIVVFPANCVLNVPEVAKEERTNFPPWKKN